MHDSSSASMIVFMAMPSSCSIPSSDRAIIFPIVFPFSLPNLTSVQWEVRYDSIGRGIPFLCSFYPQYDGMFLYNSLAYDIVSDY